MGHLLKIFGTLSLLLTLIAAYGQGKQDISFEFYGGMFHSTLDTSVVVAAPELSTASIKQAYDRLNSGDYQPIIDSLLAYKKSWTLTIGYIIN